MITIESRSGLRKKHRETGFTLIELMVVVAIIGILASIGAVQLIAYQQKAQDKTAQTDARNFLTAAIINR